MRRIVPVLCAFGLALAVPAAAQRLLGREFRVNLQTSGAQQFPEVAMNRHGDFVVVWVGSVPSQSPAGIFARCFAADGRPLSGEVRVDRGNEPALPDVAMADDGSYLVVWEQQTSPRILGRRFACGGEALTDEMVISVGDLRFLPTIPRIAVNRDGRFYVAWSGYTLTGLDVFGRLYDADGTPLSDAARLNEELLGEQVGQDVAATADDGFEVVWLSQTTEPEGLRLRIVGLRLAPDGGRSGEEAALSPAQPKSLAQVRVSRLDGAMLVVWTEWVGSKAGGIFGRRLGPDGRSLGHRFQLASQITLSAVAAGANGELFLAWTTLPGLNRQVDVLGRRFDAKGRPLGSVLKLNSHRAKDQLNPKIAGDGSGRFVAVWQSQGQDGSDWGVFARRLESPGGAP